MNKNLAKLFEKIAEQSVNGFTGGIIKMPENQEKNYSKTIDLLVDIVSGNIEDSTLNDGDWKRIRALFATLCECNMKHLTNKVDTKIDLLNSSIQEVKKALEKSTDNQKHRDDNIFRELREIKNQAFGNGNGKK